MSEAIIQELKNGDEKKLAQFVEDTKFQIRNVYEEAKHSFCLEYDVLREYPSRMFRAHDLAVELNSATAEENEYYRIESKLKRNEIPKKEIKRVMKAQKALKEKLPELQARATAAMKKLNKKGDGLASTVRPYQVLDENGWIVDRSDVLKTEDGYDTQNFREACYQQALLIVEHTVADPMAPRTLNSNGGQRGIMIDLDLTVGRNANEGKELVLKHEWVDVIAFFNICYSLVHEAEHNAFLDLLTKQSVELLFRVGMHPMLNREDLTAAALDQLQEINLVHVLTSQSTTTRKSSFDKMYQEHHVGEATILCMDSPVKAKKNSMRVPQRPANTKKAHVKQESRNQQEIFWV